MGKKVENFAEFIVADDQYSFIFAAFIFADFATDPEI